MIDGRGATTASESPAGEFTGLDRGPTLVFKGIRFAEATRFGEPADVADLGHYDATSFRAQCPQLPGTMERMLGGSKMPTSEQCLHLNVYTPGCDDGHRPVLFWVHGGAYTSGGGAMPWYDGSRLAVRGDVVVVTINYRLGPLGFLGVRNSGLLDQVAALRWVNRNIEAFGGDSGNVTVFGESAGGSSVVALAALDGAAGLYHRTLAMSPSILQFRPREAGERNERDVLAAAGADDVRDLSEAPLEALLAAQRELMATPSRDLRHFSPTESTDTITERIVDVSGRDARPMVIGTTLDEANLFNAFDARRRGWTDTDAEHRFRRVFDDRTSEAVEAYREARPGAGAAELVSAMETDLMFRNDARRLAEARAAAGHPTWMYLFDQATPQFGGVLGSCHALDIPFAFDNLHRPGVEPFVGTEPGLQDVADRFADAVISFARSADPGWERYDNRSRRTQRLGPQPDVVSDPDAELRLLWDAVAP
jgi:para-nitrobenzyl esterase